MPKLSDEKAKAVNADEGNVLLEDGTVVIATLTEVEPDEGQKGPYWAWKYKVSQDSPAGKGRVFTNRTSLSDAAYWKLKETFDAFGVSADTDTDDLIGHAVRLQITQRTINQGARAGELTNDVKAVLPLTDEVTSAAVTATGGKKQDAPLF